MAFSYTRYIELLRYTADSHDPDGKQYLYSNKLSLALWLPFEKLFLR